jgi:hypothetical protein
MAKAEKRLPRARVKNKRISTVDQAIEAMGGDDRVAKWLDVDKSYLDGMRRCGIARGYFAHFFFSLTALGYTPTPKLFGLKSWRTVTMPRDRSIA